MEAAQEWTKPRTCAQCGNTYSLQDHNSKEAQAAARALADRTLDPAALPPHISKCPACLKGGNLVEQHALQAALQVEQEMAARDRSSLIHYAKRIGLFATFLSAVGLFLLYAYAQISRAEFNGVLYGLLLSAALIASVSVTIWAYMHSSNDGK